MGGCDWPVSYYTGYFSFLFPPPLPPALRHRVVAVTSPVWKLLRAFGGVSRRRDCLRSQHINKRFGEPRKESCQASSFKLKFYDLMIFFMF